MAKETKDSPIITARRRRGCTDITFLFIFLACLGFWCYVAYVGYVEGDPRKLINPTNSTGYLCGYDENKDKKYLIYFNLLKCLSFATPLSGCATQMVCVQKCPPESYSPITAMATGEPEDSIRTKMQPYCTQNLDGLKDKSIPVLIKEHICPAWWVSSSQILGRCFPDFGVIEKEFGNKTVFNETSLKLMDISTSKEPSEFLVTLRTLKEATEKALDVLGARSFLVKVQADISRSWPVILGCILSSVVIAMIWIIILRFVAGLIVWLAILILLAALVAGASFSFIRYNAMVQNNLGRYFSFGTFFNLPIPEWPGYIYDLRGAWLTFGVILTILVILGLVAAIWLRSRINVAIEVINMASEAVTAIQTAVIFPLLPVLLQVGLIAGAVTSAIYLASAATPEFRVDLSGCQDFNRDFHCNSNSSNSNGKVQGDVCEKESFYCLNCPEAACVFYRYGPSKTLIAFQFYNFLMVLWSLAYVQAMCEIILAGAFSTWYWTLDKKKDLPYCVMAGSITRTLCSHSGTAAFGSLIIAIVQFIRAIIHAINEFLRQRDQTNPVVQCLLYGCACCFYIMETFLKYLNRNAYIMTAIYGYSFCKASQEAFILLLKNVVRVAVLANITHLILTFSKLAIVSATVSIGYLLMSKDYDFVKEHLGDLNYVFFPLILIAVGAFILTSVVLDVYLMAIDTIFLSFLEDVEKNDGSSEKPFYMSKGLQAITKKYQSDLQNDANNSDENAKDETKEKKKKLKKDKKK